MTKYLLTALTCIIALSNSIYAQKLECFQLQLPEKPLVDVTRIAILDFEGDYGKGKVLSDYMIANLLEENRGIYSKGGFFTATKEGKTYLQGVKTNIYQIIERTQLEKVLKEQKLNMSGLLDESQAVSVGKLLGVEVIIMGNTSYSSKDENNTVEYKDSKTKATKYSYCTERTVTAEARMKIVSVSTGVVLGTYDTKAKTSDDKCDEARNGLEKADILADNCLKTIANSLVNYFSPYFVYRKYNFEKIKTDSFKEKSKQAIECIDNNEIDKAFSIYKAIYDADNYNAKAAYNLGLLYEIVGNYSQAADYFSIATEIESGENDYKDALKRANQGIELLVMLKKLNIEITPHNFVTDATASSDKIKTSGSKDDRIEVYESPDAKSPVVARIPGNTEFTVLEKQSEWFLIKLLGGKQGYLPKKNTK